MDKVKEILANLQKYHFWILCGLVLVIGCISWFMAISNLDSETLTNANKIKSSDGEIQAVKNTREHPNDNFAKGMESIIQPFSGKIALGWEKRYEQQVKLLVWPETLTKEAEGFIEEVDHLRPIEKTTTEIPNKYLQVYRYFITRELPRLAETIGAKWHIQVDSGNTTGGAGGLYAQAAKVNADGVSVKETDNSVVYWNEANQKQILELHFGFASENRTPTTMEVLYAQEDLWVLQAIMQIIKKTNRGADANYDAAIKEIQSLQIGRSASGRMGKIIPVQKKPGSDPSAQGPGGPGGPPSPSPSGPPLSPGGPGGAPSRDDMKDPAYERYVDIDYSPLPVTTLKSAATSLDPKIAIYSVAKRIPVRLRLVMDQRKLSDLLAECGNFNLPVEVRQVRINSPEGLQSDDAMLLSRGGGGGMEGGMMSPARGPTMGGGGGAGRAQRPKRARGPSSGPGVAPADGASGPDPNEIEVEVYGIVYIFNPVDEKQLGVELRRNQEAGTDKGAAPTPPTASVPAAGNNPRS